MLTLTAAVCVAGLGTGGASAQAHRPVAHGLIVKLKEGASASALHHDDSRAAKRRERLQSVMKDAGIRDLKVVRLRPFGHTAQHLDFGRVLQAEEAERLMAQLRARPDVEWVEPNTRERRLAAPNDPGYSPGFCRDDDLNCPADRRVPQWWMYAVGGSNANAIADRRRGVPGFRTAWDRTTGAASAPVAVLDTGIVSGHPELSGRVLQGFDFVHDSGYANDGDGRDGDAADPGDWVSQEDKANDPGRFAIPGFECAVENSSWHGTFIAGLLVSTTNELLPRGTAGINWDGRVLPVRVAGKCGADPRDIVDGMRWAAGLQACRLYDDQTCIAWAPPNQNPAKIINISFGGTGDCTKYQDTIDLLVSMDVVIVAAAGNEQGAVARPAKCRGVVGVGAVNRDGFKTNYSNFGPELTITTVGGDPKGPGHGVWSAVLGDDGLLGLDIAGITTVGTAPDGPDEGSDPDAVYPYRYSSQFGTSFSAPLVAGAVSLMRSVNPNLTHAQVVDGLRMTARPHVTSRKMQRCSAVNVGRCICTDTTCGAGLLDAHQAVLYAQALFDGSIYTAPNWPIESIDSPEMDSALALGAADEPDPEDSESGGGGALQPAWLAALALVTLLTAAASHAASRRRARRR